MPPRPGGLYLGRVALWRLLAGYGTARQNQRNRLALDFQVTFSTERQLLFSFVRRLPLPRADEGSTRACGQALDKARGRKPRNEARLFSRGSALWAFERRPIAQVRDVRGAAPGAACCVKALPALGCAGEVRAARLVM